MGDPVDTYLDLDALRALSAAMGPERWRRVSDAAQVLACYLACHPRVEEARYPGLKADPLFERAATTLRGGFGPRVALRVDGTWQLWEADGRDEREQVLELEHALSVRATGGDGTLFN